MSTKLSPYINFGGSCKEAMRFYQSILGGELTMQTFGEAPVEVNEANKDWIMHAQLTAGDVIIMASDAMGAADRRPGNDINLSLVGDDEEQLTKTFQALAEGGQVAQDLKKEFWGDSFGMLTDKFGVHWMVNISGSDQ